MSRELVKEQSKCPFTGAGTSPKYPTGRGTSNRDCGQTVKSKI
jgi:hypothetical protein